VFRSRPFSGFSAFPKLFHDFENLPERFRFRFLIRFFPKLSVGAADKTKGNPKPKNQKPK